MGKFSDILFTSDYDFTLTDRNDVPNPRNIEAIRYFIAEGGLFTVATGRSIPLFAKKAGQIPVNAPCILYNGGACYDYGTKTLYEHHPVGDFIEEVMREVRRLDASLCMEIQSIERHCVFGKNTRRDNFLRREDFASVPVTETAEVPKPWMKLVICAEIGQGLENASYSPEEIAYMERLRKHLADFCVGRCYVTRSMPYVLEVGVAGCDKGGTARRLADRLGRKLLACAGDAPNDISMLNEADFAFVPADCDPSLRDAPYTKAAPCDDGAVADAIARLEAML